MAAAPPAARTVEAGGMTDADTTEPLPRRDRGTNTFRPGVHPAPPIAPARLADAPGEDRRYSAPERNRWWGTGEIAEACNVRRITVWRWIVQQRRVPHLRTPTGRILVSDTDARALLADQAPTGHGVKGKG
ncbi:hypothetical protein ACFOVU_12445 [Nocardiopsis sediminis]|uniref:DNA-binding protein n=1 Tax=Nocardiopsis sediminis TaxID=1778267 RepID=A0ABV8FKR9_9ACTN